MSISSDSETIDSSTSSTSYFSTERERFSSNPSSSPTPKPPNNPIIIQHNLQNVMQSQLQSSNPGLVQDARDALKAEQIKILFQKVQKKYSHYNF